MSSRRASRNPVNVETQISPKVLRITPKLVESVTPYRKASLSNDIENGVIVEGRTFNGSTLVRGTHEPLATENDEMKRGGWIPATGVGDNKRVINTGTKMAIGAIAHSTSFMKKTNNIIKSGTAGAGYSSTSSGGGSTAGGSVERLAPEVYSPLFTMANLNLPRDRITVNAWCRNFFQLHPYVMNIITLHATYPISKLNIKCHDKKVLRFFEDMVEEMNLMESLGNIALEYWKLGEAFPYAELNEETGKWSKIIIQNPDYIHVKKTVLSGDPVISLKPDAVLQRLVMSNNPADVQLRRQIPDKIIHHVRAGQDIPLDNFNISHLKMLSSPYDVRGTSIIVSAFKDLMLYDKLREAKFAQADGMINPITIIKVGGNADGDYRATQEDIEFFKQIFEEAQYDKDFKLITHAGVSVERLGFSGQVLDIENDMNFIVKNICTGLMIPPAVIDTESAVYSSASIGLEVLRQRYFNFRNMLASWLVNKIFAPISEIQNFYEYDGGEKRLIVPEVEWNHMNLYDLQDYIQNITGLISQNQASVQTLYRSLGINYQDEVVKMRQDMIRKEIQMKEQQAMQKMTITELRALDAEKEILEPIDSKERQVEAPSESGGMLGGMPGMPGGGIGGPEMGGLGGPGMPPPGGLGAPPSGGPGGPELAPPAAGPMPSGGTPPGTAPTPAMGPGV